MSALQSLRHFGGKVFLLFLDAFADSDAGIAGDLDPSFLGRGFHGQVRIDHDGLADAIDICPDVAGPVENQGCPQYKKVIIKRDKLEQHKSAVALDLMRSIKRALDPSNLMNPGRVLRV